MSEQPNILLLMSDQQKASATGVYGNQHVPSAFQDHLAAEGITFRHAFANASICTPSRASIMTGVHPLVHQSTCHQNRVPWNLPQLSEILQQNGYYTAACGHYEAARNLNRGWHEQSDLGEPGPLYHAFAKRMALGRRDVGWSCGTVPVPADHGHAALMTDRMIRMLANAPKTDVPLFFHMAYDDPHPPYFTPEPYATLIDPKTIDFPPPGGAGRPAWQDKVRQDLGSAKASEMDIRKVVATYYGMIAYVNDQMERLYQALAKRGMLENTWIIMTSDHGDYTGEKGMFNKSESLYECLLHVPLIIRPPDSVELPRGTMADGLVELVDIFPTILTLAGLEVSDYAQGHDLIAWIKNGASQPLRDYAFAQVGDYHGFLKTTLPGGMPEHGRHPSLLQGVRSLKYSYVRDPDYGDEAYDLMQDPYELNNLLNPEQEAHPEAIDDLRRQLKQWEQQCLELRERLGIVPGDRGFMDGVQYSDNPEWHPQ